MSSASIFRRSTNQPAIPYRRACAKQEDILLMRDTTIWRTTGIPNTNTATTSDRMNPFLPFPLA